MLVGCAFVCFKNNIPSRISTFALLIYSPIGTLVVVVDVENDEIHVCTTSEVAKSIISICPCSVKMHWGGGGDDVLALGSNLSSFSSNLLHLLLELNVYVISFVFKSF